MKILISEALRLKNEIAEAVRKRQAQSHYVTYGETLTDGVTDQGESLVDKFDVYLAKLEKLFGFSQILNAAIDAANKENNISNMARELANVKVRLEVIGQALPQCAPREWMDYEKTIVNQDGTPVSKRLASKKVFKPWVTKAELKESMAVLRARKRALLTAIAQADNTVQVEVPFSYEDLEGLLD